ncbi:thiamine-phosphate kinase [Cerasicoccus frondis]|uniref:thiamine-phosphate kinase n=1 Tax=Cerasicoccus frondis TaxID=490090 RepID=UPI0028524F46|nr:thiamine-phosphate kinase [Cerasicoccus frondis]
MTPFTEQPEDQIAHLGEVRLIEKITEWMEPISPPPPFGIGDDCAVMDSGDVGTIITTVDALIWNEHFDDTFTPEEAGAKLVKRNLSDIAAMGGAPAGAVIALTLADNVSVSWLERFYVGIRETAIHNYFLIVGGDVTRGGARDFFGSHLTLMGSATRAIRRQGGQQAGDHILVTGELGGTRHGKEKTFLPRLREGQWFGEQNVVKAMIDVTDGLAKDLPALLPNGACALLKLDELPISSAAKNLAAVSGKSALEHALCDGEDYELLIILDREVDPALMIGEWAKAHDIPLTLIGTLAEASDDQNRKLLNAATGQLIDLSAFQHFKA